MSPEEVFAAVEGDSTRIAIHPIMSMFSDEPLGYEVLSRWQTDDHGPLEFIPIIKDIGLSRRFSEKVLKSATLLSKRYQDRQLWVNLSPEDLSGEISWILDCLENTSNISLEVTEESVLTQKQLKNLLMLKENGISLYLDDFSINHPHDAFLNFFHGIKIDKSILWAARTSNASRSFLRGISVFMREKGISVIVEGIETIEDRAIVLESEISIGQGFLFGTPEMIEKIGPRRIE